jgi:hypothetical protein
VPIIETYEPNTGTLKYTVINRMSLPVAPRIVEIAGRNDLPCLIGNAAEAYTVCLEAEFLVAGAIVKAIMVVAMEHCLHPHCLDEFVDDCKAVRVTAGRLVGNEDVGALFP